MWCIIVTGTDGNHRILGYGCEWRCREDAETIRRAGGDVVYCGLVMLCSVWGDQWRN